MKVQCDQMLAQKVAQLFHKVDQKSSHLDFVESILLTWSREPLTTEWCKTDLKYFLMG